MNETILQENILSVDKPLKKNYVLFTFILLIFLTAFFFPKNFLYVEWIRLSVVPDLLTPNTPLFLAISPLITELIGKVFIALFILLPGIILAFLVRKYLHTQKGKIVFLKIPAIVFLLSILFDFPIGYFSGFGRLCSREGCMGLLFLYVIVPCVWLVVSLLSSFFVFFANKNNNLKNKIAKIFQAGLTKKIFIALFLISAIFLIFSIIRFYISSNSAENLEQKEFFAQFPELHSLIRTDVNIGYGGITTYGNPGIQNYDRLYTQGYSTCLSIHRGDDCYDNYVKNGFKYTEYKYRDFSVIVYAFKNSNILKEGLGQKGIVVVNSEIKDNLKYSRDIGGMEGYNLSTLDIKGCNVARFTNVVEQNDIRTTYMWISEGKNYLIQVETNTNLNNQSQNIDEEFLENLSRNFGC